jgi:hypothetical protein
MNSYVFVFAALLAVAAAAKGPYPKCPWVTAKYPFDEAKVRIRIIQTINSLFIIQLNSLKLNFNLNGWL